MVAAEQGRLGGFRICLCGRIGAKCVACMTLVIGTISLKETKDVDITK